MEPDNHIDPVGLLPKIFGGEATHEEQQAVDAWLERDPVHRAEYNAFARLWEITGGVSPQGEIDLEAEWKKMDAAIAPSARRISLAGILRIAAMVLLVSALGLAGLRINSKRNSAPSHEIAGLTLPDGSRVTLNAGSRIIYRRGFGVSHRELELIGEAYFEVAKNPELAFTVSSGEARIKVTGTVFNVKAYRNKPEIRVTVTEGRVSLYDASQNRNQTLLGAGETGTYNRADGMVSRKVGSDLNDMAWKTGILDFHNTPLPEVADILTNTYHRNVILDPALNQCSVTVRFERQDLDSVLNVIGSTLDLTITSKGKRRYLTGKGC
jgi:ferric-dicitrate binding protein FerR (iron transport regulator)